MIAMLAHPPLSSFLVCARVFFCVYVSMCNDDDVTATMVRVERAVGWSLEGLAW